MSLITSGWTTQTTPRVLPLTIKRIQPVIIAALLLLFGGVPSGAADEKTVEITVVKNDTVIDLCEKYLDNPSEWPRIVRFNRLQNQDLIFPGQKLLIPIQYLKGLPSPGRVVFLRGDVAVRTAPNAAWLPLKKDDRVMQGTLIRTGADGLVEILFENGTSFTQKQDSLLDIRQSKQKSDSSLWQRFFLQGGRLILRVRRALGQEQRMEIDTPAGAAVARGTEFRVSVSDQESMTSEVLDGNIDVRGMNRTVALDAGYGTRVTKGEAPLEPRALLPPPEPSDLQSLYRTLPFALSFKPVPGAVYHRAILFRDAEGKDIIREKILTVTQSWEITGLDDGEYYLSCSSIDNAGIEGAPLALKKIRVRANPLPPFIQTPVEASAYKSKTVAPAWLKVRDAVAYQIEISPDRGFSGANVRNVKTSATGERVDLQNYGTYFFRIRSVADDGYEGMWSDTVSFSLIPPPPAPPVEKPALDDKTIQIRWKSQGDKMTYRCQVARDANFTEILTEQKVTEPRVTFDRPDRPGVYHVRTSTIDPDGYEGGFSDPQTFEIKNDREKWVVLGTYGMMLFIILLIH